ncbi:MAG: hypothetical protein ACJ79R_17025 [Anaeromyxobacteraceae bacterium]
MRRIALLTLLTFGCATVRPPEGLPPVPPPASPQRLALAEPELELWMEGTRDIDPAESAAALAQSKEALSRALDGRGLDEQDPDALVVIRARAIARTGERRTAQTWSAVGIVVGIVFVVVAAIVLSRSGGNKKGSSARGAHAAVAAPGPRGGVSRALPVPYAPRYARAPGVGFFFGFNVVVPIGPYAPIAVPGVEPTDSWLARRGWFDGDELELTVEVTDPATGDVRERRVVRDSADPRDPAAVSRLVDRALAGLGNGPLPSPPPGA